MRNIIQYPITLNEICEALEAEREKIMAEDSCGDMRPLLFNEAIKFMRRAEENGLTYEQSLARQKA